MREVMIIKTATLYISILWSFKTFGTLMPNHVNLTSTWVGSVVGTMLGVFYVDYIYLWHFAQSNGLNEDSSS